MAAYEPERGLIWARAWVEMNQWVIDIDWYEPERGLIWTREWIDIVDWYEPKEWVNMRAVDMSQGALSDAYALMRLCVQFCLY